MGKRARKTRWRTLTITDEHSDSEESYSASAQTLPKGYYPKSYYNKFPYSSQSTPRRRFQHDGSKSTRSSSTASENKITFNEDEYTRITTPRQDVLFKKGYLNKPKNYQTQTSTGTSTTSTGNSTGNGTPDHQSTDLEYESQFVFPNGFVDQNGIYYVNGYESYPLMVYNPPTYYPELSHRKSKRYSTGSLTESMSPNNEEATSQDLSGGEASNNVSDYSGHHPVYNMIYPGYYEICPPHDAIMNGQYPTNSPRRIKKRRRRKTSKCQTTQDSSEYSEDESDSGDEENPKTHSETKDKLTNCHIETKETSNVSVETKSDVTEIKNQNSLEIEATVSDVQLTLETGTEESKETLCEEEDCTLLKDPEEKTEHKDCQMEENEESTDCGKEEGSEVHQSTNIDKTATPSEETTQKKSSTSTLKPDAEEFIPRAYRNSEVPVGPNTPFLKIPPNFVPIPILPVGDFNGQTYNPAFIPPGIPINFLPPNPKMFPNFLGFVPNKFVPTCESGNEDHHETNDGNASSQIDKKKCDNSDTIKEEKIIQNKEPIQKVNSKSIDIATIVSKLEEAAKEQEKDTNVQQEETQDGPRKKFYDKKYTKNAQKYKNYKKNYFNSSQCSPQKKNFYINGTDKSSNDEKDANANSDAVEQVPETNHVIPKPNGSQAEEKNQENQRQTVSTPERVRKAWKNQQYQNGSPNRWHQNNTVKNFKPRENGKTYSENDARECKVKQNGYKNYSQIATNKSQVHITERKNSEVNNEKQRTGIELKEMKTEDTHSKTGTSPVKTANQWISVSNRKKRKNKNVEDADTPSDIHHEGEKGENDHEFESYDVSLLVDVVLPIEEEVIQMETTETIIVKNELEDVKQNQVGETTEDVDDTLKEIVEAPNTNDTDKEVVNNVSVEGIKGEESGLELNYSVKEKLELMNAVEELIDEIVNLPEIYPISSQPQVNNPTKKKCKRGSQKPLTKRVIITDLDLSMNNDEIKSPIKKVVTKLSDVKNVNQKTEDKKDDDKKQVAAEEIPNTSEEEEKKKNKKKKKKTNKITASINSLSSSSTTINNIAEDSFDFLLDSALSDESVKKTNIEVSQELDKLIQRGMYNSLEEKIRSLNIDESDGFFKSVFSSISSREPSVEKTGFAQTPDLGKILENTRKFCASSSVSQENNSQNREINKVLPDLEPPDEDGLLENPNHDLPQDLTSTENAESETLNTEEHSNCDAEVILENEVEAKSYPITQAVKEWMNKTREKTPDVVLLKSPSDIYKEFCDSDSESDSEVTDPKYLNKFDAVNNTAGDDEVTIFTKENVAKSMEISVEKTDLMEYWEDDVGIRKKAYDMTENNSVDKSDGVKPVEEGQEAVEVYESKYGNNEDFLQLKKETMEKTKNSNYPKHESLPYSKAICCNIM